MKKMIGLFVMTLLLVSCMSLVPNNVQGGTFTTIDTLGGYSYEAINVIKNFYEGLQVAKDDNGNYILYSNVRTYGWSSKPGSLIVFIDGERQTLLQPLDWRLSHTTTHQSNTSIDWIANTRLNADTIKAFTNANEIRFRVVNTDKSTLMGNENGSDISDVLPLLKQFISN